MTAIRLTVLALLLVGAGFLIVRELLPVEIEPGSVLEVEISGRYVEAAGAPFIGRLLGLEQRSLLSLLSELRKAELDDRLANVVLRIRSLQVGWAKAQEIRDAIAALRDAGRHPIALVEVAGFGANKEFYVASAAEQVFLAPGGGPPLIGLAQEYTFLGGLWEWLGVELQVTQAGEYKGALESFTGHEMSPAYRLQAEELLASVDGQFAGGIAASRGIDEAAVRRVLASAPSRAEVLQELGLVDGVATRRELLDTLDGAGVVTAAEYAGVDAADLGFEPEATFALLYGAGSIVSGHGTTSRTGEPVLAADTVVDALEQAADDDSIAAIVLRVDSPGGGPFPSELVWQAIRAAREKKPVIASFSDYAASGGYYLASAADAIVSNPATLTGSIGVFAVRPSLGGLLERFGIGTDAIALSPHAELLLMTRPLSQETRDWLQADVDDVYRRFVSRVAEGRGLEWDAIDAVADGRVWTGAQAVEIGLVDRLGGLRSAVDVGRERLGLDPSADVALLVFPPPAPLAQQISESLRVSAAQQLRPAIPLLANLGRIGTWVEALATGAPALVPPIWVEIR